VRGGLSNEAALQSITIVPARILGVDHRVGTLEVGKDADILVTDGDILHYETFVQWAIVYGDVVYDKQEELFYAHIRPRAESPEAASEATEEGAPQPAPSEAPETPSGQPKD
jgi:adenine deaminase